eukprot:7612539-Alexandrium_andersonii.AAC.1
MHTVRWSDSALPRGDGSCRTLAELEGPSELASPLLALCKGGRLLPRLGARVEEPPVAADE